MRRWTYLVVAALFVLGACGGSDKDPASAGEEATHTDAASPAEPEESPSTPPVEESELAGTFLHPGRYKTDLFTPAFAFTAPDLAYPFTVDQETKDAIFIVKPPGFQAVVLSTPTEMYAEDNKSLEKAPDDLLAWFEKNPYLKTAAAPDVNVGGTTATAMDVEVASKPKAEPSDLPCPDCVAIHPIAGFEPLAIGKEKVRVAQLDVEGDQVLLSLICPKSDFELFLKTAEPMLKSITWKK
jgi:hypothetical protein